MKNFISATDTSGLININGVLGRFGLLLICGALASLKVGAQEIDENAPPAPTVDLAVVESSTSVFLRWSVEVNTNIADQEITETRITWQAEESEESTSVNVELNSTNCEDVSAYPVTCETTLTKLVADTSYDLTLEAHGVVYESGTTNIETDYGFGSASDAINRHTHADFELPEDLLAGSERQQRMPVVRLVDDDSTTASLSLVALFTFLRERGIDTEASNPHRWSYSASVSPQNAVRTDIVIDLDPRVEDDLLRLIGTYRDSDETTATVTVTATYKEDASVYAKRDIVFTVIKNRPPVFGVTAITYEMPEDDPSEIYVEGHFQLSDAENHSITYSMETVEPDDAVFEIGEQSGVISLIEGEELDYETASQHILHVTATDSVGDPSNTLAITVDILDVDEGPTLGDGDEDDLEVMAHQNMGVGENWVNFHVRNWFVDEENDPLCYSAEITSGETFATVKVSGSSDCGTPHVQVRRRSVAGLRSVKEVEIEITATEDVADNPGSSSAKATVSIVYGTNIEPNILGGRLVNASSDSAYLDSYDAGSDTSFDMIFTALDVLPSNDRICFTLAGEDHRHFELVYPNEPYLTASCKLEGSNSSEGSRKNSHRIRVKSIRNLERDKSDSTYRFDLVATDLSGFADTLAFELTTDNFYSGLFSAPIPDAHLLVGEDAETLQLEEYFDHTAAAESLTYKVRSGNSYAVEATENDGVLTLTPVDLFDGDSTTTFVVVNAEDEDGETIRETFDVHVKRHNNAPRFERVTKTYEIDEDTPIGEYFTKTPYAYDPDDEEIYFRLEEKDQPFVADSTTGHITISESLDFETQNEYELELYVEDRFGGYDTETITVKVIDVNEAPIPTEEVLGDVELLVGLGLPEELLGTDHFTDPDADDALTIKASSSQSSTASVDVDVDGYVTVEAHEEGTASVSLEASDTGTPPLRASKSFLVTVNENTSPTLTEQPEDMDVSVGVEKVLELESIFDDEPQDVHTYTAKSADSSIATTEVSGSDLTISGESEGSVRVTITVTDAAGNVAKARLDVNVNVNAPPSLALQIEDIQTRVGRVVEIQLSSHFEDVGDELEFEVVLNDEEVAEAVVLENDLLQLTGMTEGDTLCSVTATDTFGESIEDEFEITVLKANNPPVVTRQLEDIEISLTSHVRYDVDIEDVYDDESPDELDISVESSTEEYADVVLRENNTVIRIYPLKRGDFFIFVTAEDDIGQTTETDFHVAILSEEINTAPYVEEPISDQTIYVDEDFKANLDEVFADQERDDLTYTADTDDSDVATVGISDSDVLTVNGASAGNATISLEATDPSGESATDSFEVTVKTMPVAHQSVATVTLQHGGENLHLDMHENFSDADGDHLHFYMKSPSSSDIADISLADEMLVLAPLQRGTMSVIVIARDTDGNSAQTQFNIVVSDEKLMTVARNAMAGYGRSLLTSVTTTIGDRAVFDQGKSGLSLHKVWNRLGRKTDREFTPEVSLRGISPGARPVLLGDSSTIHSPSHPHLGFDTAVAVTNHERPSPSAIVSNINVWSKEDSSGYAGAGFNGHAKTRYLGGDLPVLQNGKLGLALMGSSNESSYSWGSVEENLSTSLRSIIPYFVKHLNDGHSVWASIGHGRGESQVRSSHDVVSASPLRMKLATLGLRRTLTRKDTYRLSILTDLSGINLSTESVDGVSRIRTSVRQMRTALDGSLTRHVSNGFQVTPFGQIGIRHDHGDGVRGEGIEVRGGVRLSTPAVQIEAKGGRFRLNDATDIQEFGWSILASYDLHDDQLGWNLNLRPSFGCAPQDESLEWMRMNITDSSYSIGSSCNDRRVLQAEIAYGSYIMGDRFKFVPQARLDSDQWGNVRRSVGGQIELGDFGTHRGILEFAVADVELREGSSSREMLLSGSFLF